MIICGLDFSIRNAGFSYIQIPKNKHIDLKYIENNTKFSNIKLKLKNSIDLLYESDFIYDKILNEILSYDKNIYIVLENYAYSSTGFFTTIAEITGNIKKKILSNNIKLSIVSPFTVKKVAMKGNKHYNKKEFIIQEFKKDFPKIFEQDVDDNIIDSIYMMLIGIIKTNCINFKDMYKFNLTTKYLHEILELPIYKMSITLTNDNYTDFISKSKQISKEVKKQQKRKNSRKKHNKFYKYPSIIC